MVAVLEPLQTCYRELDAADEFMAYMEDAAGHLDSVSAALVLADLVRERQGDRAAAALLANYLRKHPTIEGIVRLISLNAAAAEGVAREDLEMVVGLVRKLIARRPAYKCTQCGFSGRELHWQCPGCKSWSTVKPMEFLEG